MDKSYISPRFRSTVYPDGHRVEMCNPPPLPEWNSPYMDDRPDGMPWKLYVALLNIAYRIGKAIKKHF